MYLHLKYLKKKMKPLRLVYLHFVKNKSGGSTIESGLLIVLAMILFLLFVAIADKIYTWITTEVDNVLDFSFIE
jgi:Flp pilus assembly pilin Flp